jgi:hypothetical protein
LFHTIGLPIDLVGPVNLGTVPPPFLIHHRLREPATLAKGERSTRWPGSGIGSDPAKSGKSGQGSNLNITIVTFRMLFGFLSKIFQVLL